MNTKLYIIRDELSGAFGVPQVFPNEDFAKRWFRDFIKADRLRNDNAGDFSLWFAGDYDTKEGQIKAPKIPQLIERGLSHELQN